MAMRDRTSDIPAREVEPSAQRPAAPPVANAAANASRESRPGVAAAPDPGMLSDFAEPTPTAKGPSRGGKTLIIVESPSKAKTISGYLGSDFKVLATLGHVRDLPESPKGSKFGIDIKTWTPEYVLAEKKAHAIKEFLEAGKTAGKIYIASDPDREGEAIAWHVEALLKESGVDPARISRATWRAITPEGIKAGLASARAVDMNMVKSQEARRILDRVVGYTLTPWLMRQTGLKGLSAGRVQSAALQEVVDRDFERANHIPIPYGAVSIEAEAGGKAFKAALTKAGGLQVVGPDKEGRPGTRMLTSEALASLTLPKKGERLYVINAETKPGRTEPKPPFTTTSMTVAASNSLGLSTDAAMKLAQKLYERGLITYHRSDSPEVSEGAIQMARAHIAKAYGPEFVPAKPRQYKAKAEHAQEGHECVRPTHLEGSYAAERAKTLAALVASEGPAVADLYNLIERRFIACQMADKQYDSTVAHLGFGAGEKALVFKANGNITRFEGFTKAFAEEEGEEAGSKESTAVLPPLAKGGYATAQTCETTMKKTTPKPAFTEATLTVELEKLGIGRPSTYASIFATIRNRGYVESANEGARKNVLTSSEVGRQVVAELKKEFPKEMDYRYTAAMEDNLDKIAAGKLKPEAFLDESYRDLQTHFT